VIKKETPSFYLVNRQKRHPYTVELKEELSKSGIKTYKIWDAGKTSFGLNIEGRGK
jgi:hypothetical protein